MLVPSITTILTTIFLVYILHSIWVMTQLFIAPICNNEEPCLRSSLHARHNLMLVGFVYEKPSEISGLMVPVWKESISHTETSEWTKTISVSDFVRNNGTLFLHVFVTTNKRGKIYFKDVASGREVSQVRSKLTQISTRAEETFKLLGSEELSSNSQNRPKFELKNENSSPKKKVNHIKTKVSINMLASADDLSASGIPPEMLHLFSYTSNREYLPPLQYNFLRTRLKDLEEVKPSTKFVNVTLGYVPVTFGKVRFLIHLESSLLTLKGLGFSDKDLDDIKGIFEDTNLYLLCVTVFVASIHVLFDFLALKNDIYFWKGRSDLTGLSGRAMLWRCFSQIAVFLYLLDEKTSLLVLIPSCLSTMIELWKAYKVAKLVPVRTRLGLPFFTVSLRSSSRKEEITQEIDAEAMRYLSYLLYPLCVGWAIYSLLYESHKGWYSWTVNSVVHGVYAFGFLFMLPQLFINYRLKSVAHMPWRSFMYKAFNTFIDDLFAFIITMPTAHRFACFRDDVVFIIYLYQRWLYPVDTSRRDDTSHAMETSSDVSISRKGIESKKTD